MATYGPAVSPAMRATRRRAANSQTITRMGGGLAIDIIGLEELGADLEMLGRDGLRRAIRESLRNGGGQALAAEMRNRAPVRSGTLRAGIDVHQQGAGGDVEVGYKGGLTGSSIVNSREQRGAWVESGVGAHFIQPKVKRRGKLTITGAYRETSATQGKQAISFNGGAYANALHPGYRGRKVAQRSIAAASWEVLADVVDQIDNIIGGGAA